MMSFIPTSWAILKIDSDDPHYRIFGSIVGGYLNGDSWKVNSGIVSVTEDDNYYYFNGHSGSVYQCHKKAYGSFTSYPQSVLSRYCETSEGKISCLIEIPDDLMSMDFILSSK